MRRLGSPLLWLFTAAIFLLTLGGLLLGWGVGDLLLSWAAFLAAVALILGVLNLFVVHLRRAVRGNGSSLVLLVGMLAVFVTPLTDRLGWTENGADSLFRWIQTPLEAAVAALLAFFLLFAGIRLVQRQDRGWAALFGITALLVLLGNLPLPGLAGQLFRAGQAIINSVLVSGGMRGILIGIALGAITMSLRLLAGAERPYSK